MGIMPSVTEVLSDIYYNPKHQASFASRDKLFQAAKKELPWITEDEVKEFLRDSITYTLHYPRRHIFPRNRIMVNHIHELHQADLADMSEERFVSKNSGYKYLLTVIDVFSKQARVEPLKSKQSLEVARAFELIYRNWIVPVHMQTDQGTEFKGVMKKYFELKGIHHYTSRNQTVKCAVVERFNRTLKSRLFKYVTSQGNERYVDRLEEIVDAYNNTLHRSIKMSPNEVSYDNEDEVFNNLYGYKSERAYLLQAKRGSEITVGDKVRIKHSKEAFIKGYLPNFQDMVFEVVSKHAVAGGEPLFKIKTEKGKILPQRFYRFELQKVSPNPKFRIQSVGEQKRTRRGKTEYLVKYVGHPSEFDEWKTLEEIDQNIR